MVELSQVNLDLAKANASDNDPTKPEDLKDLDAQRYAALLRSQSAVSVTAYANELSLADEALKSAADLGYGSWTLENEAMLVYEKSVADFGCGELSENLGRTQRASIHKLLVRLAPVLHGLSHRC